MRSLVVGLALLSALASGARANLITFTVNSASSSMTASGTYSGDTIQAQSAGSLTTSYTGTVQVDINYGAQTITFVGGTITAQNSGSYQPPFGSPSAANYGTLTDITSPPGGFVVLGAVRNFSFS